MMCGKPTFFQPPGLLFLLVACVAFGGCGRFRLHRPRDLANAQQAQTRFQAADLANAVAAERARLDQVLADELDLVRRHTLARRDARLLYVIGEGDSAKAWEFLKDDLEKRLKALGIQNTAELEDRITRTAQAKDAKENLQTRADQYENLRRANPSLPEASCPPLPHVQPPAENTNAGLIWKSYTQDCQDYLKILTARGLSLDKPLRNGAAIEAMKAAKEAAQQATAAARQTLADVRAAYAEELARSGSQPDWEPVRKAALVLIERAEKVKTALDAFIQGDDRAALDGLGVAGFGTTLANAQSRLGSLGLDLSVVGNLGSLPALARLEAERAALVAGLSSTLQGETATKVLSTLQEFKLIAEGPTEAPVTAMVLKEKQLALDIAAAQDREAFYDKTLALLEQQEAAYRDELAYLGEAELRRQEFEKDCLSTDPGENPEFLKGLFTYKDPAVVKCREIVFRLLVQYSAAWTFGRVESEQVDYRLIALHHEAALDTSNIAFQKWASLLGPPIDQLVAYTRTGLRPQDIVNPIINAFGLGAVAVGVN